MQAHSDVAFERLKACCEQASKRTKRQLIIGNFNRLEDLKKSGFYSSEAYYDAFCTATAYDFDEDDKKFKKKYSGDTRLTTSIFEHLVLNAYFGQISHAANCEAQSATFLYYLVQSKSLPETFTFTRISLNNPFDHVAPLIIFQGKSLLYDHWLGYYKEFNHSDLNKIRLELARKTHYDTIEQLAHLVKEVDGAYKGDSFNKDKIPQYIIDHLFDKSNKKIKSLEDEKKLQELIENEKKALTIKIEKQKDILSQCESTSELMAKFDIGLSCKVNSDFRKKFVENIDAKVIKYFESFRNTKYLAFEHVLHQIVLGKDFKSELEKIPINATDIFGKTLIWHAAFVNNVKALEELVQNNDPLQADLTGFIPITIAMRKVNIEAMLFLAPYSGLSTDMAFDALLQNTPLDRLVLAVDRLLKNNLFIEYVKNKITAFFNNPSAYFFDDRWSFLFEQAKHIFKESGSSLLEEAVDTQNYINVKAALTFESDVEQISSTGRSLLIESLHSSPPEVFLILLLKAKEKHSDDFIKFSTSLIKKCKNKEKKRLLIFMFENDSRFQEHGHYSVSLTTELEKQDNDFLVNITVYPVLILQALSSEKGNAIHPLFNAIINNCTQITIATLVSNPAVFSLGLKRISALQVATASRNYFMATSLLSHSSTTLLNLQNSEGNTALHIAVALGDRELCHLLLYHQANATIANNAGDSAYAMAMSSGDSRLINLFNQTGPLRKPTTPNIVELPKESYLVKLAKHLNEYDKLVMLTCTQLTEVADYYLSEVKATDQQYTCQRLAQDLKAVGFPNSKLLEKLTTLAATPFSNIDGEMYKNIEKELLKVEIDDQKDITPTDYDDFKIEPYTV